MIRSLRRRHLRMMLALAILVPLLVFLALVARPEPPSNSALPDGSGAFADDTRGDG
jgi:hypothetical protein